MSTLLKLLQEYFCEATKKAFPQLSDNIPGDVTQSTSEQFGHYQCNIAMKLAKPLQQTPRKIAEALVNALDATDLIERLEIAGPGFINVTLKTEYLSLRMNQMLQSPNLGIARPSANQRIMVEFSSPNVAKELHVGHLRSTIIGDCLARVFEFLGYDVTRLNHVGDWGTQFGMLIAYIREAAPEVLTGNTATDLTQLVTWYRLSKQRFDNDEQFKKRARLEVVALQQGTSDTRHAWEVLCTISRHAYQEIYDLLDVRITERGESFYNPMLAPLVEDLEKRGFIQLSEGAKCLFVEGFQNREGEPLPLMIQKSDGGYNYDTTDMAAIRYRIQEDHFDRLIYVTDAGQSTHFAMIFKAAQRVGYLDPAHTRLDHVPFGLVLGSDGKKFKTRSGDTEKLIDLLTQAVQHAETILLERNPEMPLEERQQVAQALGIGAVKYADLSSHRLSDYTFSYERMLRFDGNTAAFILYSYVRVQGIKRKIGVDVQPLYSQSKIALLHSSEISLGLHLLRFGEVLDLVANDLLPNRLTDYLYGLAEKFNAFFRDCRVEGSAEEPSRLLLCDLVGRTLKQGLALLGIRTVERM